MSDGNEPFDTTSEAYTQRLRSGSRLRRYVDVHAPYRWNIARWRLGKTLDVGCGIGRHLAHLPPGSVGVDHNKHSVHAARSAGMHAFAPAELPDSGCVPPGGFDALLIAHVLEHMTRAQAADLLTEYVPYLRAGGTAIVICPQQAGYASDPTHVEFVDQSGLAELCDGAGLRVIRQYSFPFPQMIGRVFLHNEFCTLAVKPVA